MSTCPTIDTRVAAIFRRGSSITPDGTTVIEADDEVFFIAASNHIDRVMSELRRLDRPFKRVMIAGGGHIGMRLAKAVEHEFSVKVIEFDEERCVHLAESLQHAVTLHGDATDRELLLEENIEQCDAFCAVTNDDEVNIMSSLLAKRLGVRQVITLIGKPAYVDLVQGGEIDIAISPQQATTSTLLTHVRRADVAKAQQSAARCGGKPLRPWRMVIRGTSKVVGRAIDEIDLPPGTSIAAVVRGEQVLMAHHDVVIEPDDHVIMFLVDKRHVAAVEKLFQVGLGFF